MLSRTGYAFVRRKKLVAAIFGIVFFRGIFATRVNFRSCCIIKKDVIVVVAEGAWGTATRGICIQFFNKSFCNKVALFRRKSSFHLIRLTERIEGTISVTGTPEALSS